MAFFLFCWHSVIIFLVFMYSVCIVNMLSFFFSLGFIVKLWYFSPLHFKGIPFTIESCWTMSLPKCFKGWKCFSFILLLQKMSKYSVLFAILCIFFPFFFFLEDWAVNWSWGYTLYLFDNLIGGMEVNKLAFCMEHIGINSCIYVHLICILAPWIPMRNF